MHYSAFISYRHAELDSAVAAEVQRRLEHFHVPAEIQKKTGKKKIGSIFRDREELPITSDLNQNISDALNHSDFLIVICSTRTKESYWVPREIDYFLQTHSKDRVLTVLVDGEPFDVIPEALLTDTIHHTGPDGTETTEVRKREPLSGDFRSGIRKSRKSEISRLAAALLGCGYDELIMREHQFRRRRLLMVFGVSSALMLTAVSYLLWSRQEIRKNYERAEENLQQALVNQSMYLSSESGELLEKGYRIRAIQLAMEAMPRDGDRPFVPEAVGALSSALHTYITPETRSYHLVCDTISELRTKGRIQDFFVSSDNKYICATDDSSRVYLWDAETGAEVLRLLTGSRSQSDSIEQVDLPEEEVSSGAPTSPEEVQVDGTYAEAMSDEEAASGKTAAAEVPAAENSGAELPTGETAGEQASASEPTDAQAPTGETAAAEVSAGKTADAEASVGEAVVVEVPACEIISAAILSDRNAIVLLTDSGIFSYGIRDGQRLWKYDDSRLQWGEVYSVFQVSDDGRIYLAAGCWEEGEYYSSSGKVAAVVLRGADGQELYRLEKQAASEDSFETVNPKKCTFSADGERMAAAVSFSEGKDQVLCFDFKEGSCSKMDLPAESGNIKDLCFIDNTHVGVIAFPEWDWQVTGYGSSAFAGIRLIEDMNIQVGSYDAVSGDCQWTGQYTNSRLDHSYQSGAHNIGSVTAAGPDGKEEQFVYSVYANQINIYYAGNGKKFKEVEFEGEIVNAGQTQKGGLKALLANGNIGSISFGEESSLGESTWFEFDNEGADWIRGGKYDRYLLKADDRCLFISEPVYDTSCNPLSGEPLSKDAIINAHDIVSDHLMVMDYDAGVHIYDLAGEEPPRSLVLGEESYRYKYIGKDDEEGIAWFIDEFNEEYPFTGISVKDGKKILVSSPVADNSYGHTYTESGTVFSNGRFGLFSYDRIETALLQDGKLVIESGVDLNRDNWYESFYCLFSPSVTKALETVKNDKSGERTVFLIDLESGKSCRTDARPIDEIQGASWDEKEEVCAFTDGQTVFLADSDGTMRRVINIAEGSVVSLQIHENLLFVLCSGGNLQRYDLLSGDMLGKTDITSYEGTSGWEEDEWLFGEDKLILVTKDGPGGDLVRILETDTWKQTAASPDALEYDTSRDRMICNGRNHTSGEQTIVWYPLYSPDDLMNKAEEVLHGAVLSDEDRALYGLEKRLTLQNE